MFKMTIAKKLTGLAAIGAVLTACTGFAGYLSVGRVAGMLQDMLNSEAKVAQHAALANSGILGLRRFEKDMFLNIRDGKKVAEYEKKFLAKHKEVSQSLAALGEHATHPEDKGRLEQMRSNLDRYIAGMTGIVVKIKAGQLRTPEDGNKAVGVYKDAIHQMETTAGELAKVAAQRMAGLDETLNGVERSALVLLLAIAVAAALLVLGLSYAVAHRIIGDLRGAVDLANAVAGGDLTRTIAARSGDEIGQLLEALGRMNTQLASLVGRMRNGTQSINTAAVEITAGNSDLSQRTQEQASALEETASSMEQMTSTVKHNADNARQANQLAANARKLAEGGTEVVTGTIGAMDAISDSSKKIADIIGVINEIAFQTNLLALNAAVEAARAGEQGRGFAVVATEVRNLAQRSAQAAKEIKELIVDSVDKVKTGSELVDKSGTTLSEIVTAVKKVSDIIAEIAAASQEQSSGIDQVNKAVMQMDQVTQQNAALVEETAAASKSMEEQAKALLDLVSRFKVDSSSAPVSVAEKVAKALPASSAPTVLPIAKAAARKKQAPAAEPSREIAKESPKPAPKPRPAKTGTEDGEWEEF